MRVPIPANASLDKSYAERIGRLQSARWKQILDVQRPYRWNLRRLKPGRALDVGCGVGRNLAHLAGSGVGVDANEACVAAARAAGFEAYLPQDLPQGEFDSLLFAHVLEHVRDPAGLVSEYLPRLAPGGQVIIFTPQEQGYESDASHVSFLDFDALRRIAEGLRLCVERTYSFPFPRWAGKYFPYNEFVMTARRAAASGV